jgi:hypothetical protein
MPTTVTSNGARRASTPSLPHPPPSSAGRRDRSRVAAGGLVLTVCTLAAVLVYGRVGDRHDVLAMARTVEVGQVVQAGDLRVVHVSADPGVHTVRAAERARIVGQPAAVRLLAGTMLSADQVGDATRLPAGTALVGAVVKAGQFPLGLAAGDTVGLIVSSPTAGSTGASSDQGSQNALPVATVVAVQPAVDATGNTAVSLQVPLAVAPAVADAGAAGRLNLVVMGR